MYCGGLRENRMKDAIMLVTRQAFCMRFAYIVCVCECVHALMLFFLVGPYVRAYEPHMPGRLVVGRESFHRSCCGGV